DKISINNSTLNNKSNVNYKNKFLWPIRGKIISRFGSKGSGIHEDGIKIAVHEGEEVQASKKGEVIYSGNGLRGFGNLIIIKHKNGWITAYGHNQVNLVKMGKIVKEGEIIAKAGSSGGAKTPQLYFQLRRGFETVDPQKFLL
ncbi:MAG: peptidoglycan DD-metalloendopeptidase family protein, partial [Pseudomonadota bacterium]|nr:peptidoglycan DD-metalloendopeptidase family protein [Pseudomonadota bacterium]